MSGTSNAWEGAEEDEEDEDENWEYEDDYEHAFVDVNEDRVRPQDVLPTDPDHLRVWRVQNQTDARRRHEMEAEHTRAAEKKRERDEERIQKGRVLSFRRRFFCWVRIYDLCKLRLFCCKWSDIPLTLENRLDRSMEMQTCQLHSGRTELPAFSLDRSRAFQLGDRHESRRQGSVFPSGSPWGKNTQDLYLSHTNELKSRIGFNMTSFHFNAPSILAQQFRIAYMVVLWYLSPRMHDYLRQHPIVFEDDPSMEVFRSEALNFLRTFRRLMQTFHIDEQGLRVMIMRWIYISPLPSQERDMIDPTFLHRLHDEELGTYPNCLQLTPPTFLSSAKKEELRAAFTSGYARS